MFLFGDSSSFLYFCSSLGFFVGTCNKQIQSRCAMAKQMSSYPTTQWGYIPTASLHVVSTRTAIFPKKIHVNEMFSLFIYIYMFIVYILQCTIRTYQTSHHVLCVFCCWEKAALQIEASEPQKTQTLASTVQPGGEKGRGWDGGRAFGGSEKSRDFQGFTWESKVYMDTPGLEASTIN